MKQIVPLWLLAAAFAGCLDVPEPFENEAGPPGDASTPGPGFAPQEGRQETSDDAVSLVGDLRVDDCDAAFCIHAVATNENAAAMYVNNVCTTPWSEALHQDSKPIHKSEPMATCAAWGVRPVEAGEQLHANFTWDGSIWDDDAQTYRDAPDGAYTWSIQFSYHASSDGGDRRELEMAFPVVIGAT